MFKREVVLDNIFKYPLRVTKSMRYEDYVDPQYIPASSDLLTELYMEPEKGVSVKQAAGAVAAESSIGTWTELTTTKSYMMGLAAKVFSIRKDGAGYVIKVAYPIELFEPGNMPNILSGIAGNIFGMKEIKKLRLEDIYFPEKIDRSFKGPKFGVPGVRKLLKIKKRPLVGTIVKPKLGLNSKDHAKVAYEAWIGGCDVVKDDENLSSQAFNPFNRRVKEVLKMREKAERETGERKAYMANVTAETNEAVKRAKFIKSQGGRYAMIDIITMGWSAVQTIRNANLGLVLHAHRAMHAAITRDHTHGLSMLSIAKIARMIGVDQLHIGTAVGKMEGGRSEVKEIQREIEKQAIEENYANKVLAEKWEKMRPVFAVASGGLDPLHVPALHRIFGNDVIIQMGGGIHGHPWGTKAGAKAARDAIDAVMEGRHLRGYSKELDEAIRKWG